MSEAAKESQTERTWPQLPGLSDLTLTEEAARELSRRLDNPSAHPARPPQDLPKGDPSVLHQKAR